jgi:hypothetical protein
MRAKEISEDFKSVGGDFLFEMANLVPAQTGIDGIVYISTKQASHSARVKYFVKTGRNQPSFSVSIGSNPEILDNSLPKKVVNGVGPKVIEWVTLNQVALLNFWENGTTWTDPQVTAFKAALQRV